MNINDAAYLKERIISTMKMKGPSLPINVGKTIGQSTIFASAFLSELYSEGKVKISNLKVGSSPLYFLPGQEPLLENFIQYLNQKEKEAFQILKERQLLDDEKQHPAIRVALRAIKDFAIPLRITIDGESKNFWRFFLLPESEIKNKLENKEDTKKQEEPKQEKIEEKEVVREIDNLEKIKESIKEIEVEIKKEELKETEEEKPKDKKKKVKESDLKFVNSIKDYLSGKEIEIIEIISEKKNEFIAKIRTDTTFGKQEYYLIAKDKKKIIEDELIIAVQKANEQKMPALLMTKGDIDKKAIDYLKSWRNMIKVEKIKI